MPRESIFLVKQINFNYIDDVDVAVVPFSVSFATSEHDAVDDVASDPVFVAPGFSSDLAAVERLSTFPLGDALCISPSRGAANRAVGSL